MKKALKITGIVILAIFVILLAIPFVFKGKIIALAKTEINKSINAKVEFEDIDISLIRRFPRVSASLENLRITGLQKFRSDTLISADDIDVALDLMSFIRGDKMKIHSIDVVRPRIHAVVAKDGSVNWDIMKPDSTADTSSVSKPFNLELQRYAIHNGYIAYRDSSADMYAEIRTLDHEGSGDFTADVFTLQTKTNAEAVNFIYGPVPYLVNTRTNIQADLEIDNRISRYSFKTDNISLNELKIATDGFFQLVNDSTYNMDIRFNAPSTDFKNILSLIPVVYQKDFASVKTSGKAIFNGFVKGTMTGDKLPAYAVNLDVTDGFFQYPDLPAPVKNINIKLAVNNPDGATDHTVVNLQKAHFEMENDPFDLRLLLKTPVSDMWIDAEARGKLDLSKITRMVKLDEGTSIKGLLNADVSAKGSVDAIQKQQFDKFSAAGNIALKGFLYKSKDYPQGVVLNSLLMTFNPRNVTLNEANGSYLGTNFDANGAINNLLGYSLKNYPLDAVFNIKADKVNVNAFMGTTDTTASSDSASGPFIVPANLDIELNAVAGQVKYDNLLMENVSGTLHLENETVKLSNVKGNALGGSIMMNGSYSTLHNKKKPAIALKYDVENLDVQQTFNTFNTVQKLMPIGKFLSGKMSSEMTVTGNLGENMMPDLASLAGAGNVFLIQGLLEKFRPLEKLGERLNINELQNLSLREVREQFEFNAGKVFVKPFKMKVNDIEMEIGGMHGFDQSLDYTLQLRLPRALMGSKGNQLVTDLASKATAKGIPVQLGETVNLNAKMLGSIMNPEIKLDLAQSASSLADQMKEQAKEFAQAKVDSAKKAVNDTLQSLKKEAIKEASERLKAQLFNKTDTAAVADSSKPVKPADRLKESGRGLIENINPFKKKQ